MSLIQTYSFGLVLALFWTGFYRTPSWTAKLEGDLLALGFRRVLFDLLLLQDAPLERPVGAFLLRGVALRHLGPIS